MNKSDRNPLRELPGKGDKLRSCHTKKFRKNFDKIDWGKNEKYNINFVLNTEQDGNDWSKDCIKLSKPKEVKKCDIERDSGGDDLKLKDLQSQLEDYRKALEWIVKEREELAFIDGNYQCTRGRIWHSGSTPLSAIQSAMAKEREAK